MIEQIFASANPSVPLFRLAFRPFFLFGAIFSAVAIIIWALTLNDSISLSLYGGPLFWHIHEMLFGFTAAIIVGFLLTAVQTWTGVRSVNGWFLFSLFAVWLTARVGFVFGDAVPANILVAVDTSFLLLAALFLSIPLLCVKQFRNLFFVPVLLLFAGSNGLMHVGLFNQDHDMVLRATRTVLLLVAVLMVVIGGRVIPMFTANGTKTKRASNIVWLDRTALASSWLIMLLYLGGLNKVMPAASFGALFIVAGTLHTIRLVRWRFWVTLRVTLLWPLHLAYGFVCLAYLMLGCDLVFKAQTTSVSWHLLTVGGMGLLILAMISRVSLGHTGRMLVAQKWMSGVFVMVVLCTFLRTFVLALVPGMFLVAINLSAILWALAFGIFALGFFSILTTPRIDKKPG